MPRKPRVQFPGAIYHIVTRGDGRRQLFHDDGHYERLTRGLSDEVKRSGWIVLAYCWMPNHIHLLLKTPEPNLSCGMQHWLSGYANWYAKRNRRTGHLFQGRYKSYLVENDSYFWTLSRYIHLNPCSGKRPLCEKPEHWKFSSYAGYARKTQQNDFVDYETLFASWSGEYGGTDPITAYRRFVAQGLKNVADNPLKRAREAWVIGSQEFLKCMVTLAEKQHPSRQGKIIRRTRAFNVKEIIELVANEHQVDPSRYLGLRCQAPGREMAALLCRRLTSSTLADLSREFGLRHPDSSANLVRLAKRRESDSWKYREKLKEVERKLIAKTENQV